MNVIFVGRVRCKDKILFEEPPCGFWIAVSDGLPKNKVEFNPAPGVIFATLGMNINDDSEFDGQITKT